ncbi:CDP-glycerol glycerophosphotransferase family protein [Clostridium sp. CM028]|uniref:CDP-glycerol glycerophosphotransferase family protein n=1 Tax=unclassified Clostridium TaxID=2614128 RepID=UPI001C6F4F41|nr:MULTISPECIES: CDP-glycerol glycerophosphotransferase family protein [unclassified Clostridium]MBW9145234.1 CDP-glycerol glycerophosphotransferase family protein [Clostridium sp. CM027]MBW9148475.1 CDP-glycerol glycerophosphotransferase family protein [Clostridium sp. CM028]UVE40367.1 CDP-glycerol glycerophosphotransferase family protein [Clostridium sp. CM027]WLC61048.1 CDP-glycerol glycerophosphotransferase family protein [Clostridium sp. CM028]
MKKRILLTSQTEDNIKALLNYYEKNIKKNRSDIVVEYSSFYKYKNIKILHYIIRASQMLKNYSAVVSDYTTSVFSKTKNGVFMSHGYGTKNTPGNSELDIKKTMDIYKGIRTKIKNVVTLSERDSTYFLRSTELDKCPLPNYMPLGLPRNDMLFDKEYISGCREKFDSKHNTFGMKILLFCPTWRGYEIEKAFPFTEEDWIKFDEFMGQQNWKMIYRPHYLERLIDDKVFDNMSNILTMDFDEEMSTQSILAVSDMLLTDYSSIYVDYLVLDRPICFMPYDIEQYEEKRGLAIDFTSYIDTPGPKLKCIDNLMSYIKDTSKKDEYIAIREAAQKNFYHYLDGNSCKRVWSLILDLVDKK